MPLASLSPERVATFGRLLSPPGGHRHFWDRAVSRRRFLAASAGTVGVAVVADALGPARVFAAPAGAGLPTPIPNGIDIGGTLFHLYLPGAWDTPNPSLENPGGEQSTIHDFNGFVGVSVVRGTGTGTNPDGSTEALFYEVDQRFMKGTYIDRDGRHRNATFGFV